MEFCVGGHAYCASFLKILLLVAVRVWDKNLVFLYCWIASVFGTWVFAKEKRPWDFPGGPMIKNLPSSVEDVGSIPGQGAKISRATGQLNPCRQQSTHVPQWRPSTANTKRGLYSPVLSPSSGSKMQTTGSDLLRGPVYVVCVRSLQSCPTLCHPMDCSPPGSSPWDFSGKNTGWVAMPSSRASIHPRDRTRVSCISCIGRQILYHHATWESPNNDLNHMLDDL